MLKQLIAKLLKLNHKKELFKKVSLQTINLKQCEFVMPFADETKKLFPEAKHNALNISMQDRISKHWNTSHYNDHKYDPELQMCIDKIRGAK